MSVLTCREDVERTKFFNVKFWISMTSQWKKTGMSNDLLNLKIFFFKFSPFAYISHSSQYAWDSLRQTRPTSWLHKERMDTRSCYLTCAHVKRLPWSSLHRVPSEHQGLFLQSHIQVQISTDPDSPSSFLLTLPSQLTLLFCWVHSIHNMLKTF